MEKKQKRRVFDFYPLEDRVLLSGEGTDGLDCVADADPELTEALLAADSGSNSHLDAADLMPAGEAPATDDNDGNEGTDIHASIDTPSFDPALPLEVIFIDEGVEDSDVLLNDLRAGSDGTQWLVITLSSDRDGIDQITNALSQLSGIDAIHIVSHGDGEGVTLGNTRLDLDSAPSYAGDIAAWGHAMDSDADLLIYGCDLASTESGQDLIDILALVCDCDVAASDDATGAADLGGDWILEYTVGDVQTEVAFGFIAQASWHDTLATIFVTTTEDEADGDTSSITALEASSGGTGISLREAIIAANNTAGDDTIILGGETYDLDIAGSGDAAGDLNIKSNITIQGAGAQQTSIAGAASGFDSRLFTINNNGDLTLQSMTVQGGSVSSGAAVFVFGEGSLVATDVVFRDNNSNSNSGVISAFGDVTLNRVALIDNSSANEAGAIRVSSGTTTLTNVTLSGNTAGGNGGAINVAGGTLIIDHSTIADNETTGVSGGGLHVGSGSATISNSIFADNTSSSGDDDVSGTIISGGFNIIEDDAGFTVTAGDDSADDITGVDPALSALALIGGTFVHTFDTNSNAFNAATKSTQTVDQRGVSRTAKADIGAYESVSELAVDTEQDEVDGTTTDVASLLANKGADGFISLREAIIAANNDTTSAWTILLGAGTYDLEKVGTDSETGDLDITSDITIVGLGTQDSIINNGLASDRLFEVQNSASLGAGKIDAPGR